MTWIVANWGLVSLILVLFLNIAAIVVAKTANTVDNKVLDVLKDILLRLSFVSEDANGNLKPGMPGFAKKD